ncbi:MAG: LytTR family DNA-binding domain-containing protein [Treponema sp.]|nr:LytTR family DNA-binding domain-containing protein [Treponema sp.]
MFNIVICDDSEIDLLQMKGFIESCPEFDARTMQIKTFSSGVSYIEEMKENTDLLLTDMQMELMNGFETAREMRRINQTAVLCFCSSVVTPQAEHFEVMPYRYIIKNSDVERIKTTIRELIVEMKHRKEQKTIELVSDGVAFLVPVNDILYLEKQKHGTKVTLSVSSPLYKSYANISSREKLADLAEELKPEGFASPHSSYLVNIRKIFTISNESITMENEQIISISRGNKENFHHEFSKYFSKKYRRS